MKTTVGSMIQSLQHDVRAAQARVRDAKAIRSEIHADLKLVKKIAGRAEGRAYVAGYSRLALSATISVRDLKSLKYDPRLLRVLERAIDLAEPKGSEDYVSDWCAERTFKFSLPNGGTLSIEGRLANDGDTGGACRKVQVGVEMQETPVYQILCD